MLAFFKLYLELANLVYSYFDIFFAPALYHILSMHGLVALAMAAVYNSVYRWLDFEIVEATVIFRSRS